MEDIPEKPVSEIDNADKKNPLAVVEYIDDLYAYYKRVEVMSAIPGSSFIARIDGIVISTDHLNSKIIWLSH